MNFCATAIFGIVGKSFAIGTKESAIQLSKVFLHNIQMIRF